MTVCKSFLHFRVANTMFASAKLSSPSASHRRAQEGKVYHCTQPFCIYYTLQRSTIVKRCWPAVRAYHQNKKFFKKLGGSVFWGTLGSQKSMLGNKFGLNMDLFFVKIELKVIIFFPKLYKEIYDQILFRPLLFINVIMI